MMTAIDSSDIEGCVPCKYCGQYPKLNTEFFEDGDSKQEISCQSDDTVCVAFSYVDVKLNLQDAINEWNNLNKKN
jgi:hypothetical protein